MIHHQNLPKISLEELRVENQKKRIGVASDQNMSSHFHTGCQLVALFGYAESLYSGLPEVKIASRPVNLQGKVIGFNMTPEILKRAQAGTVEMGATNFEFKYGLTESFHLPDCFANGVISNGVLNLTLDQTGTICEWHRVIKPGGRLQVGSILVERPVPVDAPGDISLWAG